MAEDLTELVTIRHEGTEAEKQIPRGALDGFTNSGWVVLDAAGRKKAQQPAAPTASKEL